MAYGRLESVECGIHERVELGGEVLKRELREWRSKVILQCRFPAVRRSVRRKTQPFSEFHQLREIALFPAVWISDVLRVRSRETVRSGIGPPHAFFSVGYFRRNPFSVLCVLCSVFRNGEWGIRNRSGTDGVGYRYPIFNVLTYFWICLQEFVD